MRLRDLFIFLLYYLSSFFTNYEEERENKETKKKETLEAHRNSNNDITGIVRKISTK